MKARLYSCAITDTEAGGVFCYDKSKKPDGTWDWPKNPGFSEPPSKKILPAGTNLDRYGDPSGSFYLLKEHLMSREHWHLDQGQEDIMSMKLSNRHQ